MRRIASRSLVSALCLLLLLLVSGCDLYNPHQILLSVDASSPGAHAPRHVMAMLLDERGYPIVGQDIVFTWKVRGSTQGEQAGATKVTDEIGRAVYSFSGNGAHRVITVTATAGNVSQSIDIQFGDTSP